MTCVKEIMRAKDLLNVNKANSEEVFKAVTDEMLASRDKYFKPTFNANMLVTGACTNLARHLKHNK